MLIDIEQLRNHKFISLRKHPRLPLYVANYTPAAAYTPGVMDDPLVRLSRGLVVDEYGNIILRPFDKFFNIGQVPETRFENLPLNLPFNVYDKLDGSLGIFGLWHGELIVTTRGTFESEQAQWAEAWIRSHINLSHLREGLTYLAEILYHENLVVVPYAEEKMVLLAVRQTNGLEHVFELHARLLGMDYVNRRESSIEDLLSLVQTAENIEGWVVKFDNGLRVKVKTLWYVERHRAKFGLTEKTIKERLMLGLDAIQSTDPDELHEWIRALETNYCLQYAVLSGKVEKAFDAVKSMETRKEQALHLKAQYADVMTYVFGLLDGMDVKERIWKAVEV